MIAKNIFAALVLLGFVGSALGEEVPASTPHEPTVADVAFAHEGPFGKFDQHQLQRGLQVYTEVCADCHGLKYLAFRNLGDEGGPEFGAAEVKAYAAQFEIVDADTGEPRPGIPSDKFLANTDAGAPDLTLMAKGRAGFHGPFGTGMNQLFKGMGGPEYIHAILTGYTGKEKEEAGATFYENTAFPGGWIKMPPPLEDGKVAYANEVPATVDTMSMDVASFLMWSAEPKMMARKHFGFVGFFFLGLIAVLLYLTNKRLWAPIKRKAA